VLSPVAARHRPPSLSLLSPSLLPLPLAALLLMLLHTKGKGCVSKDLLNQDLS
jgi:hypothetical protein